MCGFLGAFGPHAPNYKERIEDTIQTISYRGPDGEGLYVSSDGNCVLGHVRLAILDLSEAAAQPMCKHSSALVYNGEIYNHQFFRPQLEKKGWIFSSSSDTETLIAGLRLNGHSIIKSLNGMFAAAWYDERSKNLLIFRDCLGIKPLFFATLSDSTVLFSSEIKAIFSVAKDLSRDLDEDVLRCYLTFENYPQQYSLFKKVESLQPGESRIFSLESKSFVQTIESSHQKGLLKLDTHELIHLTRQKIENSVRQHLLSDVPMGVYLSGGLDSSLVACMAARHAGGLTSFTGFFDDKDSYYDERPYSRMVAKQIGIEFNEVKITANDFINHFDKLIDHLGQPRMGMGSFSQYMVARIAGKNRKVFLSGHGGDELFAGYPIFKAALLIQNGWLSARFWQVIRHLSYNQIPWVLYMTLKRIKEKKTPLAPALFTKSSSTLENNFHSTSTSPLNDLQAYYQSIYLPGLLLVEDALSMAHSLETRVPLWSSDLINWANRIEMAEKLPKGQLKGLLREVAKGIVPKALLSAPKRGFPTPLRKWFRKELLEYVTDRLLYSSSVLDMIIPRVEREKLIYSHVKRPLPFALDERRAHRIWILLCIESWTRQYKVGIKY